MLKPISHFCSRFPWIVILVVFVISALFYQQIATKLKFDADITKSLPTDLVAVKSDDYFRKNFNFKDNVLIGVEKPAGSVMEVEVLRKIEQIVLDIKALQAPKTFNSILTGKKETLIQSVGIDTENISSVANLDDAILDKETGSVVSGSVIEKLKKDNGIESQPGTEELLPETARDIEQIIPELTRRILQDRSFKNSLLTEDLHSSTIRVPLLRKFDYKKRYAILELSTALDENRLKERFQGKTPTFPFTIYGKTINQIEVNDAFIKKQVTDTRKKLSRFLNDTYGDKAQDEPALKELLNREMTVASFQALMVYTERRDFYSGSNINTWFNSINNLWDFTLEQIDPFSRENLEFQLHDVGDIFNLAEIYRLLTKILDSHRLDNVNYYVAGTPVIVGVIGSMMSEDLATLGPIAVLVIFFILGISFRSVRGVIIPALTVVLSVIWTIGIMAILGISIKMGTTMMPIILLGIGTAYGIHLLNRYYEDAATQTDRQELVQKSVNHVGVAVTMAAITTVAGFSSLATAGLSMIQEFGIFSALGVFIALILSLTLTPALLVLWKLPKQKRVLSNGRKKEMIILRIMRALSETVSRKPKQTVALLGAIFVISIILATGNHFEGAMVKTFKEQNPIYQSDQFMNENLTGTTNINLLFKFRDRINLDRSDAQADFRKRLLGFSDAWQKLTQNRDDLRIATQLVKDMQTDAATLPDSLDQIMDRLQLVRDMLNEEFMVEAEPAESSESLSELDSESLDEDEIDSLDALGDEGEDDDLGGLSEDTGEDVDEPVGAFADLSAEQVLGLKDINQRLGLAEEAWEGTGNMVLQLREIKGTPAGLKMQRYLNLANDFLAVDIKQPVVLHKLEGLYHFLKDLENPVITIRDKEYTPTGFVMTPVDLVRKFYKVFYHNDNPAYDRLPNVETDGFSDITLTDRAINGVVLNQALSGSRDAFEGIISPDLKEFQVQVMLRSGSHNVIDEYLQYTLAEMKRIFPDNDPYIERILIGGTAPTSRSINNMMSESQLRSILLSFVFVFIVTFFIFRSAVGGLYSLIPLAFTVVLNFGLIRLISGEINTSTMLVASISIGTGVDYTIHFLERLKIQLKAGDNLSRGYVNTVMSSGKAILLNATAVALGFLVLVFSVFVPQQMMGILMAATMFFSSVGALILLPALVLLIKPKFLTRLSIEAATQESTDKN